MGFLGKLSDAEFKQMLELLKRYVENDMDQWELWKFDAKFSKIYVNVSMKPSHPGTEEAYVDMNNFLGC
ncbi:hypothetical protein [uncultured Microbulbifer sp.]|uniref:hypothetical protein n=1 Tax=uncultured Microbulbifer sp. TaxID=348147 RepID=UPI00262FA1DA|nr:hypothetical protein [uncultured Microbulbifer sp.]